MMGKRSFIGLLGALCVLGSGLMPAQGQEYPDRAITHIVPTAAGGGQDTVARLISIKLSEVLKQTVVVDNRPGAGGSVGAGFVAKADPDGYTILMTTMNNAINMSLVKDLDYDLTTDLTGVTELVQSPFILCVNPNLPAKTFKEFVDLAKSKPGQLNYASSGIGGSSHLAMELLKTQAGIDMLHIPLEGSGPSVTELLAGRVDVAMLQSALAVPLIQEGKVTALAITSAKRSTLSPDIPSIAEFGLSDYDVAVWYGITVPGKTPDTVVQKLHEALLQVLADEDIKKKLQGLGFDIVGAGQKEFNAVIANDVKRWGDVIKAAGISAE